MQKEREQTKLGKRSVQSFANYRMQNAFTFKKTNTPHKIIYLIGTDLFPLKNDSMYYELLERTVKSLVGYHFFSHSLSLKNNNTPALPREEEIKKKIAF